MSTRLSTVLEAGGHLVVAADPSATFSRPGPRLVDGLETLAHVLHPRAVPDAPGPALAFEPV